MRLTKKCIFNIFISFTGVHVMAQKPDLVQYVNTLQGTNSSYEKICR